MAYTYSAVTPVGSENPKTQGWYEYNSTTILYFPTTDTTVQNGKTYYKKSDGYLVKIGEGVNAYEIPFKYIKAETYKCVWSVNDFESYRDANAELHRDSVSDRRVMKVEFETPDMDDNAFQDLMSHIRAQYIIDGQSTAVSKTCMVTAYMPEEGEYKTDKCYLTSDVNISIRFADKNKVRYSPVRLAFIGYGTDAQLES